MHLVVAAICWPPLTARLGSSLKYSSYNIFLSAEDKQPGNKKNNTVHTYTA